MQIARLSRLALMAATFSSLVVAASIVHGEDAASPRPQSGPIVPKPEALQPSPFTLEERYLDAARRGDMATLRLCLDKGVDARAKGRMHLMLHANEPRHLLGRQLARLRR